MGLADEEGADDAEWPSSGEEEVAVVVAGVPDAWGVEAPEDMAVAGEPKIEKKKR